MLAEPRLRSCKAESWAETMVSPAGLSESMTPVLAKGTYANRLIGCLWQPADIGIVDEFAGKILDVRANKGILICSAGFTSGARARARRLGIDLCNLHDAQSRKWKLDLKLPVLWIDLKPTVRLEIGAYFMAGDGIPKDPRGYTEGQSGTQNGNPGCESDGEG